MLLGQGFAFMELTVFPDYPGFLLAILPPGGFILVGLLLALKSVIDRSKANLEQEIKDLRVERVFTAAGVLKPRLQEGDDA